MATGKHSTLHKCHTCGDKARNMLLKVTRDKDNAVFYFCSWRCYAGGIAEGWKEPTGLYVAPAEAGAGHG